MTKPRILFVINTLGQAGAEKAMLSMMRAIGEERADIDLYVLTGQGELKGELPPFVRLLNKEYHDESVLSDKGRSILKRTVIKRALLRLSGFRAIPYEILSIMDLKRQGKRLMTDKLLWRILSDGAERFDTTYDLAIAYLEGGSTYYVARHVKAVKKAAFIHIDYDLAGYTRQLDGDAYNRIDNIYAVSDEVRKAFLSVYPEHEKKTRVFYNIIDQAHIRRMSREGRGFTDAFDGIRILTVGRLTLQKSYDIAIGAMGLLKKENINARWYVLGDGPLKAELEALIEEAHLSEDFILLGAVENPYPYIAGCDIYVHATRFEGKSIAIQEAQTLSKPIVVSDVSGNREQVKNGIDGIIAKLSPEAIADAVKELCRDKDKRDRLSKATGGIDLSGREELYRMLEEIE